MPATANTPRSHGPFCDPQEAVEAVARGRIVVVVDDEDRENEGDLIMAAECATNAEMGFFVRHTSGVVCVPMPEEHADELNLPLMVPSGNGDSMSTAFTVSVDLREGISTGISARERATTVRGLAAPQATSEEFRRPGHVFPLRAQPGGVLERRGHTEAAVDLTRLAGKRPVGVLAEIVRPDGEVARLPDLIEFAREHKLLLCSIADLVRLRTRRDPGVHERAAARIPTAHGDFTARSFESAADGNQHIALTLGQPSAFEPVLTRVHSECLIGDVFGSLRCGCGAQLDASMQAIADAGSGVVVYLRGHEGRGIGIARKMDTHWLRDAGSDTVKAKLGLELPVDARDYRTAAQILSQLGISRISLLTNNPDKIDNLFECGIEVAERIPVKTPVTPDNERCLVTKRLRMGHFLSAADQPVPCARS